MEKLLLELNELLVKYPNNYDLGEKARRLLDREDFQKEVEKIKGIAN